jgi:integrase
MTKPAFPIVVKRGSVVVKIYHTPTRKWDSYTVTHYQDGKRVRALFADLDEARTEAETVANRLGNTEADVLTLTSRDRASYLHVRSLLDPLGISLEEAAILAVDYKKRLGNVPYHRVFDFYAVRHPEGMSEKKTGEVVTELLAAKGKDGLSAEYLRQLKMALNTFAGKFGGPIDEIRGSAIDEWLRKQDWAPRTRNNMRNSIQTLFNYAVARRYMPKDHGELEAVAVAKDRDGKIEIYTPAELVEILNHAPKDLVPFLAIGAFAGIRHAEIQRLHWRDIQLDHDLIEIRAENAKTASRRMVPILPNLKAWLEPIKEKEGLVCSVENVSNTLQEVVAAINKTRKAAREEKQKVESRKQKKGKATSSDSGPAESPSPQSGEGKDDWKFKWKRNGLRHSFISYRVAQINDVAKVALEAGNSPQMIFQHYRELVRPAVAVEWFNVMPNQQR